MIVKREELDNYQNGIRPFADLRGANLRGANLKGDNLREADCRKADCRGANFIGANLHGADFKDANLRGTNLYEVDFRFTDLRGADLRGADLDFSCLPLWCGSLKFKCDIKIRTQLLFHVMSLFSYNMEDLNYIEKFIYRICLKYVNKFHRIYETGELKWDKNIK